MQANTCMSSSGSVTTHPGRAPHLLRKPGVGSSADLESDMKLWQLSAPRDFPDSLSGGEPRETPEHRIGETHRQSPRRSDIDPAGTSGPSNGGHGGASEVPPSAEDDEAAERGSA